jgi:hypothetical protein
MPLVPLVVILKIDIKCVTILKYTLILSPQFTRKYRKQNKQPKRKLVRQIILEINSLDMQTQFYSRSKTTTITNLILDEIKRSISISVYYG